MSNHNQYQLFREIISRSVGKTWDEAVKEWDLVGVLQGDSPETCLCGHYPILELCFLRNVRNGATATVGNVCVNRFMNIPSQSIFDGLARVRAGVRNAMNPAVLDWAVVQGWVTPWEERFYRDTWRKRVLSERQLHQRIRINNHVLGRCTA